MAAKVGDRSPASVFSHVSYELSHIALNPNKNRRVIQSPNGPMSLPNICGYLH